MLNKFLHEQLTIAFEYGVPKLEMPGTITQNLNPTISFQKRLCLCIPKYSRFTLYLFVDLVGLPFYNEEEENPFWDALRKHLTNILRYVRI